MPNCKTSFPSVWKNFSLALLCLIFIQPVFAQLENTKGKIIVAVKNDKKEVVGNLPVWLLEKGTENWHESATNTKGKVSFKVTLGKTYVIYFEADTPHSEILAKNNGKSFILKTIIYNPPKDYKTELSKEVIVQELTNRARPTQTQAILTVVVNDRNRRPLREPVTVRLQSKKTGVTYEAKTVNSLAYFRLPIGITYTLSVNDFAEYHEQAIPNYPNLKSTRKVRYQPTNVTETEESDTIRQEILTNNEATTDRAYLEIKVMDFDNKPLPNEPVYFDEEGSSKVYTGTTDANGKLKFLLPMGKRFTLHFKYERDMDLLDFTNRMAFQKETIQYTYIGSEKIENFYKTTKRNEEGFIVNFMKSPAEPLAMPKEYIKKTDKGFNVQAGRYRGLTNSPAVIGETMYLGLGYYSDKFYAIDAKTGASKWGLDLADNGPSAVVHEDDVVLIITESCTLYAIDSKSGKLLWSKWIAPFMYSTPSVANGKIYVAYPNKIKKVMEVINGGIHVKREENEHKFALAAFDLKTGEIVWQNWLDEDVVSTTVIAENRVALTTKSGSLYAFDAEDGTLIKELNIKALTPPTIAAGKVFVSVQHPRDERRQVVTSYDAKDMSFLKQFNKLTANQDIAYKNQKSIYGKMQYTSSKITHFQNKNYNVLGDKLICSSPDNGDIIWSADLKIGGDESGIMAKPVTTVPIVVGNQIAVSLLSGDIVFFNANTGSINQTIQTNEPLFAQAIIHNGWIYSGTQSGKTIAIDTKNRSLTGWNMWGGNASH